jgi:hypothetical protein
MHSDYAPEGEITEDVIENACDDLRLALVNMLDNPGDAEEYDRAIEELKHVGALLEELFRQGELLLKDD